jgi:hypothetical protein
MVSFYPRLIDLSSKSNNEVGLYLFLIYVIHFIRCNFLASCPVTTLVVKFFLKWNVFKVPYCWMLVTCVTLHAVRRRIIKFGKIFFPSFLLFVFASFL